MEAGGRGGGGGAKCGDVVELAGANDKTGVEVEFDVAVGGGGRPGQGGGVAGDSNIIWVFNFGAGPEGDPAPGICIGGGGGDGRKQ